MSQFKCMTGGSSTHTRTPGSDDLGAPTDRRHPAPFPRSARCRPTSDFPGARDIHSNWNSGLEGFDPYASFTTSVCRWMEFFLFFLFVSFLIFSFLVQSCWPTSPKSARSCATDRRKAITKWACGDTNATRTLLLLCGGRAPSGSATEIVGPGHLHTVKKIPP